MEGLGLIFLGKLDDIFLGHRDRTELEHVTDIVVVIPDVRHVYPGSDSQGRYSLLGFGRLWCGREHSHLVLKSLIITFGEHRCRHCNGIQKSITPSRFRFCEISEDIVVHLYFVARMTDAEPDPAVIFPNVGIDTDQASMACIPATLFGSEFARYEIQLVVKDDDIGWC